MSVKTGMTFRKEGPFDWWRVVGTQFPGDAHYDGGLPGVSVMISRANGLRKDGSWRQTWSGPWFIPAQSEFHFVMKATEGHRYLEAA